MVNKQPFLAKQNACGMHMGAPALGQADIGPPREPVVPVPLGLSMAYQDELGHLLAKHCWVVQGDADTHGGVATRVKRFKCFHALHAGLYGESLPWLKNAVSCLPHTAQRKTYPRAMEKSKKIAKAHAAANSDG